MLNPGNYEAVITSSAFEQAKSGAYMVHFIVEVRPPNDTPVTIHNNVVIIKADQSILQRGLKTLADLFPQWDRADFGFFDNPANTQGTECSVTTDVETYNGNTRAVIKWLNPPRTASAALQPKGVKIPPALAGKLRAAMAAFPKAAVAAPKPAAAAPTAPVPPAPAAAPAPVPPAPPKAAATYTYQSAWLKIHDELAKRGMNDAEISEAFLGAVDEVAPGQDASNLPADTYGRIVDAALSF